MSVENSKMYDAYVDGSFLQSLIKVRGHILS